MTGIGVFSPKMAERFGTDGAPISTDFAPTLLSEDGIGRTHSLHHNRQPPDAEPAPN
jgi:hypothetical protein